MNWQNPIERGCQYSKTFEERVKRLQLSDNNLIGLYRTMCTVRHFEYMADKLYAASIGLAVCLDDYLINHYRGHGHFVAKGTNIKFDDG